jgi:hypothetical protein
MSTEPDWEGITRRLDIMIMLALENGTDGATSMTGKIQKLLGFGLTPSEVARIVGKPSNYVTAVKAGKASKKRAADARKAGVEIAGQGE